MTTPPRALEALRRLIAVLVLSAAVAGVPIALWQLGGTYLPDELPSWAQVTTALSGPDTGAVFLGLLVVVGWAAWAVFVLSVAVEVVSQLRGLPPLRLPGLSAPQQLAGMLVAAVIGVGGAPLLAVPALAGPPVVVEQPVGHDAPPTAPAPADTRPTAPAAVGPTYTVQPRDTLGRIAARYLGDWTRFEEILQLNLGRPQPDGAVLTDPGLIRPGWVLALPPDATLPGAEPTAGQVIVQRGDTLADIAERRGLDSWQPIFDLNAGEPQPGGGRFTDPDLIRPGQVLDLPAAPTGPPPPPEPEPSPVEPPSGPPPTGDPSPPIEPLPTATPAPASPLEQPVPATEARGPAVEDTTDGDQSPSELMAVLAASGALLAAGLATAWAAHRRQRLRRRRTGHMLAPLPAELSATQAALTSAAESGKADYAALDLALRGLAVLICEEPEGRLPDIVAARMTGNRLQLRLHTPADRPPPPPWTADEDGRWWSVDLAAASGIAPELARGRLAPYPTLVTIGNDEGQRWLLDLERIGTLRVSGSPARREDFARHLAAELAVNSWSDLLTVTTVGFGGELADLAPDRLHPVDHLSAADLHTALREAAEEDGDVLAGRLRATAGDGWMPHVILAPHLEGGDDPPEPAAAAPTPAERRTLALVLGAGPTPAADPWLLALTDDGSLLVPALDLRLPAPELTTGQARDIAALLAFERDTADAPIPAAEGSRTWQTCTDAAGALRHDVDPPPDSEPDGAQPRPATPTSAGLTRPSSPLPTDAALPEPADAAGRAEIVRHDPHSLRQRLEADLEQLDRDLADWWSADCARPRLTLLGPVTLRAHGDEQAAAQSGLRRRHEEAVAYLATRPHGATVEEAATALQPVGGGKSDPVSARAYVHRVTAGARAWLGSDPATGEQHLSSGRGGRYMLSNVLVDADLFRQLRARAGVRTGEGMPDLLAALQLVSGPPFAQHPSGYEWLGGLDLTYTAAICDVAHQVITMAMNDDDLAAARTASATALLVAGDDEAVLLDAMWVAFHEGNRAEAETYIARIVEVHDGEDEMDLPLSSAETINRARRQYLDRAS